MVKKSDCAKCKRNFRKISLVKSSFDGFLICRKCFKNENKHRFELNNSDYEDEMKNPLGIQRNVLRIAESDKIEVLG